MSHRLFLDCGSHTGDSVRLFLAKYPEAETYTIHCFEPNAALATHYRDLGVLWHPQAVWIADGWRPFYVDARTWGSTLCREKVTGELDFAAPVRVPTIRLATFLKHAVRPGDRCVLKLDIEGAEYPVLEDLLATGTLDRVADLYVDWHVAKLNPPPQARHDALVAALAARGVVGKRWDPLGGTIEGVT